MGLDVLVSKSRLVSRGPRPPRALLSLRRPLGGSPKPHLCRDPFGDALVVGWRCCI